MKTYFKITLMVMAGTMLLNLSCKKSEITATSKNGITAAISKQIALGLYNSLLSGVSTTANNGLKVGSTDNLKTMDSQNPCGQVVTSATNKTVVSGDTTRNYAGNTVFTYLCNGYYNNNWNVDAYTLKDTLTTTETGTGFKNVYTVRLNYNVKATTANYTNVSIGGFTSTVVYVSKVSAGVTTESHKIATGYQWDNVAALRSHYDSQQPAFLSGRVQFSAFITDIVGNNNPGAQPTGAYSGYMTFLADSMVKISVYTGVGDETKDFLLNFLNGEIKSV